VCPPHSRTDVRCAVASKDMEPSPIPAPSASPVARVSGIASRHARAEPVNVAAALEEIRAVPAVSPAVLAEAAGTVLGYYHSDMDWSSRIIEAGLLIAAGADLSQLRYWMRLGAERRAIGPLEAR
jgi:hypothetical protein